MWSRDCREEELRVDIYSPKSVGQKPHGRGVKGFE